MGRIGYIVIGKLMVALTLLVGAMMFSPSTAQAAPGALCSVGPTATSLSNLSDAAVGKIACESREIDLGKERNVMRLDVTDGDSPRYLISRTARFGSLNLAVVTDEGVYRSSADFAKIRATFFDRQFAVPLPAYEGQAQTVIVEVVGATQATIFDRLHLTQDLPGSSRADVAILLIVAAFTGMMVIPIMFDLVYFRVLRERFILWHATLVASLGVQLVCSYGLYTAYVAVPLPAVRFITISSFTVMVVAAMMFSVRFIERDKRPPRLSKAVMVLTAIFSAISIVHMAGIEALGRWPSVIYFASGAPLGLVFVALLVAAFRNGSQTVRYLIVGLSPLLVVALTRVVSFILPGVPTMDANELLLVATLIEVTATALGVASRFLVLKLERDRFHAEKGTLETVAEHDPLTGLFNRRAMDLRFDRLRKDGFDTFALVDLDRFKDINDRYGHLVGDAVLEACGRSLAESDAENCVAIRLGGEEFVVMLRGPRAVERAEKLRQAIPRRVAADVPDLGRLVTASMGVLELPRRASDMMSFEEIYARADKLLYEAKTTGRNRMLYEKLQLFGTPRRERARATA